jgi:hypothetical protein
MPSELYQVITNNWGVLCTQWDRMYPENPIDAREDSDDD